MILIDADKIRDAIIDAIENQPPVKVLGCWEDFDIIANKPKSGKDILFVLNHNDMFLGYYNDESRTFYDMYGTEVLGEVTNWCYAPGLPRK